MKYAVSSYSFEQYIKAGKMTQLDTVRRAAEMGFDGIEFTSLATDTLEGQLEYAEKIKNAAKECGIEIVAYTVGANLYSGTKEKDDAEVERLKGQVRVAAALGAPLMRHDVCYREADADGKLVSFDKMLPTIADCARRVTEYARELGIRTCTENHGYIAQDSDRVEKLFNSVGSDNYGILIDIGNFACVDEPSAIAVSRLAPYAVHVHAKDFKIFEFGEKLPKNIKTFTSRGCRNLLGCAVGEGDIGAERCIAILKRAGYNGYLSIEYEGAGDCIKGIEKGFANLKKFAE